MQSQEMTTKTEPERPIAPARKGAQDGVRNELSVFLRVKVGMLHDARQVLFDNDTRLMIGTSFDGNWDVYIEDFARTSILDLWDNFLIHCEGYPDQGAPRLNLPETKEFLTAHQVTAAAYIGRYPEATVKDILKALRVQTVFQKLLDEASS